MNNHESFSEDTSQASEKTNPWSTLSEMPSFEQRDSIKVAESEVPSSEADALLDAYADSLLNPEEDEPLAEVEDIDSHDDEMKSSTEANSSENKRNHSYEDMISANRDKFDEITHRLAFIDNRFPNPDDSPASVNRERIALINIRTQLLNLGVDEAGLATAADGAMIYASRLKNYNDAAKSLAELQKTNQEFIDDREVRHFNSPEIDLGSLWVEAANVGSDYHELSDLQLKIANARHHADMRTMLKLDQIDSRAEQNWAAMAERAEQIEFEQLQANIAEAEEKLRQANESYQKLGALRRAWKAFRKSDNREQLNTNLYMAHYAMDTFKRKTGRKD